MVRPPFESESEDNMMLGFILMDYWWLAIPGVLLGLYAQFKLMSVYGKYTRIGNARGLTGAEAAREVLDAAGLHNMAVNEVGGHLTDHYDPTKKALFLSSENYHGTSLAAVGVAAHEAGHALQHKAAYGPLHIRMALVPITQFASIAWAGIALLGFLLHNLGPFIGVAIVIFTILAIFQLITLPVEFDASRRARESLLRLGLIQETERKGVSKVLNAAALTYVAALVTSVLQLLQFVMIARDRER
jgi:Zn-dependent membrane protease YugP